MAATKDDIAMLNVPTEDIYRARTAMEPGQRILIDSSCRRAAKKAVSWLSKAFTAAVRFGKPLWSADRNRATD